MSTTLKMKFVLIGVNAGKSVNLGQDGRYAFKDGELEVEGNAESVLGVKNVLKQFYSAVPAEEAKEAQAQWDKDQAALKPKGKKAADEDDEEEEAEKPGAKGAKGGRK